MLVPSSVDFEARGLSSVSFSSPTLGADDREARLTGTATYQPTELFPAEKCHPGNTWPVEVKFRIALASNPAAISHFRRNYQLSLAFHQTKGPPPPTSQSISRTSSSTSSPPTSNPDASSPSPSLSVPYMDRVLACWEDGFGAWVVSRPPPEHPNAESLETHWRKLVVAGSDSVGDARASGEFDSQGDARMKDGAEAREEKQRLEELRRYGEASVILIGVAEIVEALHERRIALAVARPEYFHVSLEPTTPTSLGIVSLDTTPSILPRVELIRVSDCVQLPGFSWHRLSRKEATRPSPTPTTSTIAFPSSRQSSDPPPTSLVQGRRLQDSNTEDLGGIYDESVIRKHLRFLAGETISSRRVTEAGDIFSLGVAFYEIVTGQKTESEPSSPSEIDVLSSVADHVNRNIIPPHSILASTSPDLPPLPIELSSIIVKCLSRELDDRYSSIQSLLFDLRRFRTLALEGGELSQLVVGQADKASRFILPKKLVERDEQFRALGKAFEVVSQAGALGGEDIDDVLEFGMEEEEEDQEPRSRPELSSSSSSTISRAGGKAGGIAGVVTVFGVSGVGKSRLVEIWAKELERKEGGHAALIGWAKMDQHLRKPLAGFVELFQSLLDRVFSDPKEDANVWREKILYALSAQRSVFLSLISSEWRAVLAPDTPVNSGEALDWENMLQGFRIWSKRVIQLFATPERPLILVIDDAQWLGPEELKLWKDILESASKPLKSVLVVSLFRVDHRGIPPPASSRLSSRSTEISLERFDVDGVASFLRACFAWESSDDASVATLVEFLFAETEGSPFFLRSLVSSLVRDGVITFSFEDLRWKFDSYSLLSLKTHSSSGGVDDYLRKRLLVLPDEVLSTLQTLSLLPSSGFEVEDLSELLGKTRRSTETLLHLATLSTFVVINGSRVRFTHDRNLAAAASLLSPVARAETHLKISRFLRRPDLLNNYLYDSVDNAVAARSLGLPDDDDELAHLAFRAAQRSALSASFTSSMAYLRVFDSIINLSDPKTWRRLRSLCFSFAALFSEVSGVLKQFEAASRIRDMLVFCETSLEEVQMRTSLVRLLLAGFSYPEACTEAFIAIKNAGFDHLDLPQDLIALVPKTPSDVEKLSNLFDEPETPPSDSLSLKLAILALLGYVGPSIYVSQSPTTRASAFTLAIALLASSSTTLRSDPSSYLIGVYSLTSVDDVPLKFAFSELALRIVKLRTGSYFESPGLVAILLDSHAWTPLMQITMTRPFSSAVESGNWDAGAYVLGTGITIKSLSSLPFSIHLPKVRSWYQAALPHLIPAARVLVSVPLQYIEIIGNQDLLTGDEPWLLDGAFIRHQSDFEIIKDLPLHSLNFYIFSLRLAICFTAGKEVTAKIVEDGEKYREGAGGLIYTQEWLFLSSLFYARHGLPETQALVEENIAKLSRFETVDFKMRIAVLRVTQLMRRSFDNGGAGWLDVLEEVDACLETLSQKKFWLLEGILSGSAARFVILVAQNRLRLSVGYARAANDAFIHIEAFAVAQNIRSQFPSSFSSAAPRPLPLLPSQLLTTLETSDSSTSNPSTSFLAEIRTSSGGSSHHSSSVDSPQEVSEGEKVASASSESKALDDLTFMRGSLLLAAERDPNVLVVTLLKILCQFVRADFGAVALYDETTKSLRLRGAGPYSSLEAYDLDFAHPEAATLAPTSVLLHVSRTKRAITSISSLQKLRSDPFFDSKLPRSILVLPLTQQGRYVGVLLLSSKTVVTPSSQIPQLTEVVSCLATFAAIALESSQSTAKLESIVNERTVRLQGALSAKTTFLSHMSHELRTPLFAVLGLAAVLEDSPGLNSVQREHLATIRASGEDLQNVVSNILDFSRLEQGDLQPESIPFTLRDVIESTLDSVATLANKKDLDLVLANTSSSDPPTLVGDPFRIKQILVNLASNAIKFTPEGGNIVVRWRIEPRDSTHSLVRVSVADTGVGIPPHKMDRLFKSFSQIDNSITRSYGGSGLGLAISQSLARLMGGSCSAKSVINVGSTFSFSFLVNTQEDSSTENPFPPFPPGRNAFVLARPGVFRKAVEEELLAFGVTPEVGDDFSDASPKLSSVKYSVILVDARLVTFSDVKELRKLQPKCKILFFSPIAQLSSTIDRLGIAHAETLVRPLRTAALYDAIAPVPISSTLPSHKPKPRSEIDPELARKYPLSILLVDDNRVNCLVGARILERFGYTNISTAFDGLEAVEKAEANEFDLVLLDLQMPVLDGYKANARIAASSLTGSPCVVALSANTDDVTMDQVHRQSFTAYLSKPLSIPALAETLIMVHGLRQERKSSSSLS